MLVGDVPTCGPLLIFSPRLALGTPENAGVTWHFHSLLGPREGRGEVATSDFVPLCGTVLKEPDFFLSRLGLGGAIHALLRGPLSWG